MTDEPYGERDEIIDDGFCVYCQKQFDDLVKHIKKRHKGTYAYFAIGGDEGL